MKRAAKGNLKSWTAVGLSVLLMSSPVFSGTAPITAFGAQENEAKGREPAPLTVLERPDSYDWYADWFSDLGTSDIVSRLNFSYSNDPGEIMADVNGFGIASGGDGRKNIEGPLDGNCAVEGASGWKDNGNLAVTDALDEDGAADTAAMSLEDDNVFKFFLHDYKDYDRNTANTDRQRIEIKTEGKNEKINSYHGEILTNRWKFFLPEDLLLPERGSFFHIFQTKATQGSGEAGMPVFTVSLTNENLIFKGSSIGSVSVDEQIIGMADINDVLGRWMEAEVTTYTAEKGYVYVKIQDISDPYNKEVLIEEGYNIDSWRRPEIKDEDGTYREDDVPAVPGQYNRSKWGLYRSNRSPVPFSEATMYLADVTIIKRDNTSYVFPDGFDPKEQSRDVTWAEEPEGIKVPAGTEFEDINLPARVDVYVEAHDKESVSVVWDQGDYNPAIQGNYTIYGTLILDDGVSNSYDVRARITIEVTGASFELPPLPESIAVQ